MARQGSVKFGLYKVELGNGATPTEVFAAPCALKSKTFELTAQNSEVYLLDCADPDAASWAERNVTGLSATGGGAGTIDPEDYDVWRDWFLSAEPKNIRIGPRTGVMNGGGYWQGPFICTSLSEASAKEDNGGLATFEVEFMSASDIAWVPATV